MRSLALAFALALVLVPPALAAAPVVACTVLTGPIDTAGKARSTIEWNASDADGDAALAIEIRDRDGRSVHNTTQVRGNLSLGDIPYNSTPGWTVRATDAQGELTTQYCSVRSTNPLVTGENSRTTTTPTTDPTPTMTTVTGVPSAGVALAVVALAALALVRKRS